MKMYMPCRAGRSHRNGGILTMPKKPKFTRESLLQEAYAIAGNQGIEEVSSRSLAKSLGCSIQPIYTHFPTMAELRQETFRYACRQFTREILACKADADPFEWTTQCVIDLARNRPNLFKLVFLSNGFTSRSLPETMRDLLENQRLVSRIMEKYDLDQQTCEDVILRSELVLLGIGTMICSNHLSFQDDEVHAVMRRTVLDLVRGARKKHSVCVVSETH